MTVQSKGKNTHTYVYWKMKSRFNVGEQQRAHKRQPRLFLKFNKSNILTLLHLPRKLKLIFRQYLDIYFFATRVFTNKILNRNRK